MLEFILQLFGGRGAGSGNKGGGHGVGVSAAGMTGTGKNGILTVSDLVRSGKTFNVNDEALYDKAGPSVRLLLDKLLDSKATNGYSKYIETITFTSVNKETGVIGYRIGLKGGKTKEGTFNTKKRK